MKDRMEDHAEEALVQAAQKGNVDAFTALVRRYQEEIYYGILGMTNSHTDADDLTQETFLMAYRNLKHFRQKSKFFTWVYRIAVNLTLNHLKRMKKEKGKQELDENLSAGLDSEGEISSPEGSSLKKELRDRIKHAVDSLPLAYKAAFNLVVFQGLTHGEAARVLGCSESTVSWRMHKARKMLQARLRPYLDEVRHEMPEI
jgi:RNA polymerase sigma-70 factor (ECF subfamily)